MDDIKQKINELFKESEIGLKFTNTSELENFTKEEIQEVEDHLRLIRSRVPEKPKPKWKWSIVGIILLIAMFYLLEFGIIWAIIWKIIPYIINITWMTLGKSFAATCLISLYKVRKQINIYNLFNK